MTVIRGASHVFLGMHITFSPDGTFSMLMKDYITEDISLFGEIVTLPAHTPATKGLFTIKSETEALCKTQSELFHSIVAKLLYIATRARADKLPTIFFLYTYVSKSTIQDWRKLKRLLQYLHFTIDLSTTLGCEHPFNLLTWVNATYAVHDDMKSHTGGCTSLGTGVFFTRSSKQKLNTKSSTEAELVSASDHLPHTLWAKSFLTAQGYTIHNHMFHQDNMSAIQLEKNRHSSAGQKPRHIDICYFLSKIIL
jgi:hypothetical protein